MLQRKEFVEYGDWVVVVDSQGTSAPRLLQATDNQSFSCKDGNFLHSSFIGTRYGGKLTNMTKTSFIRILHPTAFLWPSMVDFRTQILYQPDISMIQYFLDLKPGAVIIESGTGSGVLTTSLARSVAPHGHVHTFEFHPERVQKAKNDFEMNKVDTVVTVRQRDIVARGFPFFPQGVDAAFLDLPSPHDVIISVDRSLRPQGRICNFSPCIEQVQRVCLKLQELQYEEIFTIEILSKEYELLRSQPLQTMTYNQGALLGGIVTSQGQLPGVQNAQYVVGEATYISDREKQTHQRNKERSQKLQQQKLQEKVAKEAAATTTTTSTTTTTTNDESTTITPSEPTTTTTTTTESNEDSIKKQKSNTTDTTTTATTELCQLQPTPTISLPPMSTDKLPKTDNKHTIVARPKAVMRGHTGYLTFARKRSSTIPKDGIDYAIPFSRQEFTGNQ